MLQRCAVIFDMDGVIFDSERVLFDIWKELSEKYGFRDVEVPYLKGVGVPKAGCKKIMLDFYGPDFPYDRYEQEQSAMYHERYDGGRLPMKKGIRELLEYLKAHEFLTAVASSTREAVVTSQLKAAGLDVFFDAVIGGDRVMPGKPDPEIFLTAAKALDTPPENCIVIEDSHAGITAAYEAGMIPVMVPDLLPADEKMQERAFTVLGDLFMVRDFLKKWETKT